MTITNAEVGLAEFPEEATRTINTPWAEMDVVLCWGIPHEIETDRYYAMFRLWGGELYLTLFELKDGK